MRIIAILLVAIAAAVVLGAVVVKNHARSQPTAQQPPPAAVKPVDSNSPQWQTVKKWVDSSTSRGHSALRMQVIRPGVILPATGNTYPAAPENLRIVVTREGNRPAQIEVRQGDRQWKLSENELDQLPADIRLHVQRPLGWVLEGPAMEEAVGALLPPTPAAQPSPATPGDAVQRQFDELNARVDALFKSIESLRQE